MRSKTSDDFLITMKINSTDEYPGGLTVQDFLVSCKLMADAGIDAIEVSGNGTSHTGIKAIQLPHFVYRAILAIEHPAINVSLTSGTAKAIKLD